MTLDLHEEIHTILNEISQTVDVPRATYRIQFGEHMTFRQAITLVDYLNKLGVSHVYASPLFKARAESTHGYDAVDYQQFNPKIGTEDDFNALVEALRQRNMSILLDIVPNHMGVSTENVWWMDVLKHGPSSVYGTFFDIDWYPENRLLDNKVLIPVLGNHYGRVLEAGELKLVYWHGDFYLHYYEHQFPITPESYSGILQTVYAHLQLQEGYEEWVEMELASIITSLQYLPAYTTTDVAELVVRRREQVIIRWRLLGLFDKSEPFRVAIALALEVFNGTTQDPKSFDQLDNLINVQPYRLAYWRTATDEINYRRFFDINDLVALRIEDPIVFKHVHQLTLRLLAEGKVTGLRIDHPDGLWDLEAYFAQLQEAYLTAYIEYRLGKEVGLHPLITDYLHAIHLSQKYPMPLPLYVVVEKILSKTEPLPHTWSVSGTTGYDFMYIVNNLFVDSANEEPFNTLYADFIGEKLLFHDLIDSAKKQVMTQSLTSEISARSAQLARIIERNRRYRGFTQNSLAFCLSEIIAALSIYRTYITTPGIVTSRDRQYIEEAVQLAKKRNPLTPNSIFDFLRDTWVMDNWSDFDEDQRPQLRQFVMQLQQITGPVMAKGMEDTAFYIYNRLTSLNEVGGHPDRFGLSPQDFHQYNINKPFLYAMLSSSTHDTKRSEDVRARINVLSEMPNLWADMIKTWSEINASAKTTHDEILIPTPNDEYLFYQSLLGIYSPDAGSLEAVKARLITYLHKAINEAKVHSNWVNPNETYAQAITNFVIGCMDNEAFWASFEPFHQRIAFFGHFNALSQALLKLTVPGIPDIYQGNELWDYSLVDPDNRRPVDFVRRNKMLNDLQQASAKDLPALIKRLTNNIHDSTIKLYMTYCILNYRRDHEALFRDGVYIPVEIVGNKATYSCAFIRQLDTEAVLVVVPRLVFGLMQGEMHPPLGDSVWADTSLKLATDNSYTVAKNIFTGEKVMLKNNDTVPIASLLATFPVGVFQLS